MEEELTERQPPRGRPRLGGNDRHTQLYEMNAECVDKKLAVLALFAATCDIKTTIARYYPTLLNTSQYNTKRTQIYRWRKNEAKLRAAARDHRGQHKKVKAAGLGTVLSSAVEEKIVQWVNELRKDGIPIPPLCSKRPRKSARGTQGSTSSAPCRPGSMGSRLGTASACGPPLTRGKSAQKISRPSQARSPRECAI